MGPSGLDCQEGIGSLRDTQKRTRQDLCSGLGNLHDLKQIQFLDPMRWWSIIPTLRRLEKNAAPHGCALWPCWRRSWLLDAAPTARGLDYTSQMSTAWA